MRDDQTVQALTKAVITETKALKIPLTFNCTSHRSLSKYHICKNHLLFFPTVITKAKPDQTFSINRICKNTLKLPHLSKPPRLIQTVWTVLFTQKGFRLSLRSWTYGTCSGFVVCFGERGVLSWHCPAADWSIYEACGSLRHYSIEKWEYILVVAKFGCFFAQFLVWIASISLMSWTAFPFVMIWTFAEQTLLLFRLELHKGALFTWI